jgi:ribosome assembly protein RRB1
MAKSVLTMQKHFSAGNGSIFVQYNQRRQEYVAAGNPNGQIDLWDLRNSHQPLHTFQAHLGQINCLDWHPNDESLLISGSNDRQIKVWNIKEDRETKENKDTKETKEVTVTNAQLVYQIYTP